MTTPTANSAVGLFNFYRRYKWTHTDFGNFQGAIMDSVHGLADGLLHGAVIQGLGLLSTTGLNFTVDAGVAMGPTGNLLVSPLSVTGSVTAPTGAGHANRSLVVLRPTPVSANNITNPLSPFNSVPLNSNQNASIVILQGAESATPAYPATGVNDVILFGIKLLTGNSTMTAARQDYEVTDRIGKNSAIDKNYDKFDDRLRPYVFSNQVMGIKPAQSQYPSALSFGFVNSGQPSLFPRTSGQLLNPIDAFYNFQTGAVSGGDQVSSAFTPSIPTASNAIVAVISLNSNDTVNVNYGTLGTRAQCYAAIINQTTAAGAGALPTPISGKLLAYVLIMSLDGVNVSEIDVFDARGSNAPTTGTTFASVIAAATGAQPNTLYLLNPTGASFNFFLPSSANNSGWKVTLKNIAIGSANVVTINRTGTDQMENQTTYPLGAGEYITLMSDGTGNYWQV